MVDIEMASWGKDDDDTLRRMAANGYSGKDIAAVLVGRSRNAVLGRAWRLGVSLTGEPKTGHRPKMVTHGKVSTRGHAKRRLAPRVPLPGKPVNVEAFEVPPLVAGVGEPVAFLALEEGMCKWPVGSLFCGCKAMPGKPYCPQHTYTSKLPPPVPYTGAKRGRKVSAKGW